MSVPSPSRARPGIFARLIDWHNPGVTLLLAIWTAGLVTREHLDRIGALGPTAVQALLSLLFVVPIMLAGWAILTILDRPRRPRSRAD
jgi:hypothetical protein